MRRFDTDPQTQLTVLRQLAGDVMHQTQILAQEVIASGGIAGGVRRPESLRIHVSSGVGGPSECGWVSVRVGKGDASIGGKQALLLQAAGHAAPCAQARRSAT